MKRCAIMQPTYLPWSGYFNLISSVDVFVFLDDVQFEKQSWQTRNIILLAGSPHILSVPVRKAPLQTALSEIHISENKFWQRKHWKTLEAAYRKSLYGGVVLDALYPVYNERSYVRLVDLNKDIIVVLSTLIGVAGGVDFVSASDLGCEGSRTDHIVEICKSLSCDCYCSPLGAKTYLELDGFSGKSCIHLEFQSFLPSEYLQLGADSFVSHLSLVDLIANMGLDYSSGYILGGA